MGIDLLHLRVVLQDFSEPEAIPTFLQTTRRAACSERKAVLDAFGSRGEALLDSLKELER